MPVPICMIFGVGPLQRCSVLNRAYIILLKAKFHYAVHLSSRSQTARGQMRLRYSQLATSSLGGLWPARELVRELLASWTKTSSACRRPNSITLSSSLAGRRSVSDQIPSWFASWSATC